MLNNITEKELKELLTYSPLTGEWYWNKSGPGKKKNLSAGCYDNKDGYLLIRIDNTLYKAHRLAFLYMKGSLPDNIIDHLDRNPSNNKWSNLVESNPRENTYNSKLRSTNTSGVTGVWFDKTRGKWCAEIKVDYSKKYLGRFENKQEAINARKQAENKYTRYVTESNNYEVQRDKIIDKLHELMHTINTIHLDMGGSHRYTLNHKSHKLITELKGLLEP